MSRPTRSGFRHAADGTPLAFQVSDDVCFQVPITFQDHSGLDSLEDQAREALAEGETISGIVWKMVETFEREHAERIKAETLKLVLSLIMDSKNPSMAAHALAFTTNMALTQGMSGPKIAERFGVRKQAFFQLVAQFRAALGLAIQVPNMRSAEARDRMRRRNYRHDGT